MTKHCLPEEIIITCTVSNSGVKDVLVGLIIKTSRRNDFVLAFGPTDLNGDIRITRNDIIEQSMDDKRIAQMDYGDPEYDFSGVIVISPMSKDDIERALSAFEFYNDIAAYHPQWKARLARAQQVLDSMTEGTVININANMKGGNCQIETERLTI